MAFTVGTGGNFATLQEAINHSTSLSSDVEIALLEDIEIAAISNQPHSNTITVLCFEGKKRVTFPCTGDSYSSAVHSFDGISFKGLEIYSPFIMGTDWYGEVSISECILTNINMRTKGMEISLLNNECHECHIQNFGDRSLIFLNNTFYNFSIGLIEFYDQSSALTFISKNNILNTDINIYFQGYGGTTDRFDGFDFDYNIYYPLSDFDGANFSDWQGAGLDPNSLVVDPLFIDAPADLRLQPESPAINSGINTGLNNDLLGESRPQGGFYDIGAYEYIQTPLEQVSTPEISPDTGIFVDSQEITFTCATSGAEIRFTKNGDEPTESSSLYIVENPEFITETSTIRAKAFKIGMAPSEEAIPSILTKQQEEKASMPTLNPNGGNFLSDTSFVFGCDTPDATIHYTLDESDPETSGTTMITLPGESVSISLSCIVKAYAIADGFTASDVVESNPFVISNLGQVETPEYVPIGRNASGHLYVTIISETPDAVIHYTLDGSDPTNLGILYEDFVLVTTAVTIKAIATKANFEDSEIAEEDFGSASPMDLLRRAQKLDFF